MKNKKQGFVKIPILNNEYSVLACWGDIKYIEKFVKDWHGERSDILKCMEKARGACFCKNDGHPIIAFHHFPRTAEDIGTLAHEATHAITDIFNKIDETVWDEVFCHSIGAVVRTVLQK